MKKVFTLFAAMLFVASSFAQLSVQNVNDKGTPSIPKGVEKNLRSAGEGWFSYGYYLENYWGEGTVAQGSGNWLHIDTIGLVQFGDTWSQPWVVSVGQTYDFNSDFYDLASSEGDISMTQTNSFTIDSIQIAGCLYIRNANYTAIDTMIVGIYTNLDEDNDAYHFSYDNTCFYKVDHDPATGVQQNATIYKFPIGVNEESQPAEEEGYYYYANLEFPINLSNITNKIWHIAYTFKHGVEIGLNDTLENTSTMTFYTWADPQTDYYYTSNNENRCTNMSHGGLVCNFTNGMGDYYYPSFFMDDMHYPQIYVKVSCEDCAIVDVKDIEKENITVYPNPATNNFTVKLNGEEKAHIQLFNLVGQQVYSETATNMANVNVSNLHTGVYMLKVSQNGKVYTSKVIVK